MSRPRSAGPPTYHQVHGRLARARGPAKLYRCVDCGTGAQQWAYSGPLPAEFTAPQGPYSSDPEDYQPLCRPCHIRRDKPWVGTTCKNGHPWEGNRYAYGSKTGCILCNRESARRSLLRK